MTIKTSDEGTSYCVQCEAYARQIKGLQAAAEAGRDLFKMMNEGKLVRDISADGQPGWALRMMAFVRRLKKNHDAIDKAFPNTVENPGATEATDS